MTNAYVRCDRRPDGTYAEQFPVEAGCYVDGHHGQYAPDRLADIVAGFGIDVDPLDDPRLLRRLIEVFDAAGYGDTGPTHLLWEWHVESADKLIDLLNAHTGSPSDDFLSWGWYDGEVYLWPQSTWEEE